MLNTDNSFLQFPPIQKFIRGVGDGVLKYLGNDEMCVLGVGDNGFFYGKGLYLWLKQKNLPVTFSPINETFSKFDENLVSGKKVLVVDNGIITGSSYTAVMNYLQKRKRDLKIKDIKYAVMSDRTRLADFAVEGYVSSVGSEMTKIDSMDFKIVQILARDGRASFADIAKETGLTVSGAKKRTDKIFNRGVVETGGRISIKTFYSISAFIDAEVDQIKVDSFMGRIKKFSIVYCLARVYGKQNVRIGIVASKLQSVNEFVEKHIGNDPAVKSMTVYIGDVPILPSSK